MAQIIKHSGTVESIDGTHLRVRILQASACSACVAKRLCQSSESKEKMVDVYAADAGTYRVGESVEVWGYLSQGFRAVLWAYCLPLVLLVAVLFAALAYTGDEALSALCAVFSLFLYYLIIYIMRNRLAKKFSFSLKHLN